MNNILAETPLEGTTVDPKGVREFIRQLPNYLGWAYDLGLKEDDSFELLNRADYFEFHFGRYLVLNRPKTLHRVFYEVRQFVKYDALAAHYFTRFSVEQIKKTALVNEWYELIPRLEQAAAKIEKLTPNPLDLPEHSMVTFIRSYYPGHALTRQQNA